MHESSGINIFETMTFDELLDIINEYPKFSISSNTTLSDIEKLDEGNYIINEFPSISLIEQLPYYMNCNGEILFLKINNLWIMNVSKNDYSYYSAELMPILNDGTSVKFNIHSHPNNDKNINVGVPSINDLRYGNSSNKLAYIIHDKGVLEYDLSSVENIDKDELYIIWSKLRSSNEKFKDMNEFEFQNLFCDAIGLKRRNMSFEEFYEMCNQKDFLKK